MPMQAAPQGPLTTAAATAAAVANSPVTIVTGPPDAATGPSGTLASRAGRAISEPPPKVAVVGINGTLPSENLPMLSAHGATRRGVAVWIVVLLVFGALAAGFFLGFASARVH
jgi:hypothetical protein